MCHGFALRAFGASSQISLVEMKIERASIFNWRQLASVLLLYKICTQNIWLILDGLEWSAFKNANYLFGRKHQFINSSFCSAVRRLHEQYLIPIWSIITHFVINYKFHLSKCEARK